MPTDHDTQNDAPVTKPRTLWDTLKIPTVAVAVVSASALVFQEPIRLMVESYLDRAFASETQDKVLQQTYFTDFMRRNSDCTKVLSENDVIVRTDDAVLSAIICSATGDIYFEIKGAASNQTLEMGGILISETIKTEADIITTADHKLVAPMAASMLPLPTLKRTPSQVLKVQSNMRIVECQTYPSNGTIVRKVKTGNSCTMETINGSSGVVEHTEPVSCSVQCP